jgi:serine/threonine-protein kinase
LLLADGVASPLVMVYPMLIVASGLWFRERFVWFIGILSAASYTVLLEAYYGHWRTIEPPPPATFGQPVRHVIFFVALAGTAWGVAYLVHRLRALSSYYGQKP